MAIKTFNIDQDIYDAAQKLYPRQLSSLVEDFIRDLISSDIKLDNFDSKKALLEAIKNNSIEQNKLRASQRVLQHQLKEAEQQEQKTLNASVTRENELKAEFNRLLQSGAFDTFHFKATYQRARQKGLIPELEEYKFYYDFYNNEELVAKIWEKTKEEKEKDD